MFGEMRTSCSSSASTDRPPTLFNASGPPPTSQSAFAQVATRLACMVLLMIVAMQSATAQTAQPASADSAAQFRAHVFELVDTLPQTSSVLSIIWYAMTDLKGWAGFKTPLLYGVGALLIGWLGFMLLRPKRIRVVQPAVTYR